MQIKSITVPSSVEDYDEERTFEGADSELTITWEPFKILDAALGTGSETFCQKLLYGNWFLYRSFFAFLYMAFCTIKKMILKRREKKKNFILHFIHKKIHVFRQYHRKNRK
jgi:methanogenic corrinoid protein MtbC1